MATKKPVKKPAKRKPVQRPELELRPIKEKMTKKEIFEAIAEETELKPKQVAAVFAELADLAKASLMPKGFGVFQIPGLVTFRTRKIPAKKMPAIKKGTPVYSPAAGKEVPHPGREAFVKPATVKVRAVPMPAAKRAALGTE